MLSYAQTHPRHRPNLRAVDEHEIAMTEDCKTFDEEDRDKGRMFTFVAGMVLVVLLGIAYYAVLS